MKQTLPAVFIEMLRSYVTLAGHLNLSRTVDELGVTRQTVRRHINELEDLLGEPLFVLENRQYELTQTGKQALQGAQQLLSQSQAWLEKSDVFPDSMQHVTLEIDDDRWFYKQQQPVNRIWQDAPPLLEAGLDDWIRAKGQLEHDEMKRLRPYRMVYRPYGEDWICAEVGEQSSYATWFGWPWAKSSIGRHFSRDLMYAKVDSYLLRAYRLAVDTGGLWYDHVSASIPRAPNKAPQPVSYQRLVAACTFPDGEPAALVLVARTNRVDIPALPPGRHHVMDEADLMEFQI